MNFDALKHIAPAELGRRLATARRTRNLSQEEVADKLGVSRPTLVAIEKGTRATKPDELILFAQLYGRSVHELVSQREFIADFAPMFRMTQASDVSSEAVDAAVKMFQRACEDYLALETLMDAPMPRYQYPEPYSPGGLSPQSAAEEVATMERSRLNLGQGPIPNLLEVLENDMGLRVFVLVLGEFKIAGMFVYTDRLGGCVLVNGQHPHTRQNWSMAHEYAHFLTDRFREDITILFEYKRRPAEEQFADAFAASFLMPAAGLRQRFRRIVQSRKDFTVSDVCLLADQYGVSVEAMTRRLQSLRCVQEGTWEELSAQGIESSRVRAHLGLNSPNGVRQRLPERYVRLAVQAFEDERITESELMRLLHCSRVEAREIVDALTQPTEVGLSGEMYQLDLNFGDTLRLDPGEKMA
jgi:Zn-dependent peptidase ImmA (M78 family)/transcriptional regulator with XRE-family HTH domain